jgi:RNA polymerase sigma-70 factor (ECF subfamily)
LASTEPLVQALQKHDPAAFDALVRVYGSMVYNTALGFLHRVEDAEDATQDVLLHVYQRIESFDGRSSLKTWLYRITVNRCLDMEKQRKRKAGWWNWIVEPPMEPVDFQHPGLQAEQKHDAQLLMAAVQRLPERQRIAFTLAKLEGLSQADIALILEIQVGAVESLLSRANQHLRKTLNAYLRNH